MLILTARDGVGDRIRGLDAGADDYLVKPADLQELAARLRALVRRARGEASPKLRAGDDRARSRDPRGDVARRPVALQPREFALLHELHAERRAGAVARSSSRSASTPGARRSAATRSRCTCITCAASSARTPSGRCAASATWSPGMSAAERPRMPSLRNRLLAVVLARRRASRGSARPCSHSATRVTRSTSCSTATSPSRPRCSSPRPAKAWASSTSSTHRSSTATRAASPSRSGSGARSCGCTRRTRPTGACRRADEGFDDVVIDGERWRVFSSYDAHRGILVQVGEVRRARDAIAVAVARGLAAPLRRRAARPRRPGLDRGDVRARAARRHRPGGVAPRSRGREAARDRVAAARGGAARVGPQRAVRARACVARTRASLHRRRRARAAHARSPRCGRRPRSRWQPDDAGGATARPRGRDRRLRPRRASRRPVADAGAPRSRPGRASARQRRPRRDRAGGGVDARPGRDRPRSRALGRRPRVGDRRRRAGAARRSCCATWSTTPCGTRRDGDARCASSSRMARPRSCA